MRTVIPKLKRRNDFFMNNIYIPYKKLFRSWGYNFHKSVGMTVDETESEAVKIALEQTEARIDTLDDPMTVPHILHATRQRLLNLCRRKKTQKRMNHVISYGFYCEDCDREHEEAGKCYFCGGKVRYMRRIDEIKGTNISSLMEDFDDPIERIPTEAKPNQLDIILFEEFVRELKKEMQWRFSNSTKVLSNIMVIYDLIMEDGLEYHEICRLLDMSQSTFYLYQSRISECYFAVKNRLEQKFKKKKRLRKL